jgi:pimeloyl-ACP methyl ester carboxylesterase
MTAGILALTLVALVLLAGPVRAGTRRARLLYLPPRAEGGTAAADPGLPHRRLRIRTAGGRSLAAWIVPGRGPHTVVVSHPIGRDKASVQAHVRLLHDAGHHVVAYDLRNHGESDTDDEVRGMADKFTADLQAVLTAVRADAEVGTGRLGVLALSFSSWPAVHLLRQPGAPVDAVVCDSGPGIDIRTAMRCYFTLQRRLLPRLLRAAPGFHLTRWAFERAGLRYLGVRGWPPDPGVRRPPVLLVAAGRDTIIPPEEIEALVDRMPGSACWTAPRAIHVNALRLERAEYTARVTGFLDSAFQDAARIREAG